MIDPGPGRPAKAQLSFASFSSGEGTVIGNRKIFPACNNKSLQMYV